MLTRRKNARDVDQSVVDELSGRSATDFGTPDTGIDPGEFLRDHPVLTSGDLNTAANIGSAVAEAPPTPIDPWADDAGPELPGLSLSLSRPMQEPRRSPLSNGLAPQLSTTRLDAGEAPAAPSLAALRTTPSVGAPVSLAALQSGATPRREPAAEPGRSFLVSSDAAAAPTDAEPDGMGRGEVAGGAFDSEWLPGLDHGAQPAEVRGKVQSKSLPGLDGYDPFTISPLEQQAIDHAARQDRRHRIVAGVMQGLGTLVGLGGMAAGVPGLGAVGTLLSAGGGAVRTNREEEALGAAQERQANDLRRLQFGQQQEDRAAQREDRSLDQTLRARSVASTEALNASRRQQIAGELNDQNIERLANTANADGLRGMIQANVRSLPSDNPLAQQWAERVLNNSAFGNQDADTLAREAQMLNQLVQTHAFQSGRGLGGGGGQRTIRHADGTVEIVQDRGGGGQRPQTIGEMMDAQAAASAEQPAQAEVAPLRPAAAPTARRSRAGAPAPVAAPAPAPGQPGPVATGSDVEIGGQSTVDSVRELFVGRYGADFMNNPMAKAAYDLAIGEITGDAAQRRAVVQELRRDTMARADNPDSIVPRQHVAAYNAAAPRMQQVYEGTVLRFMPVRTAISRAVQRINAMPTATERTAASAQLVAALHGDATAAAAMRVPNLQSLIANMNEQYGRERSGAAISPSEWANFRAVLGVGSALASPQSAVDTLDRLIGEGGRLMRSRAATYGQGVPADQMYRYFIGMQHAGMGNAPATAPSGGDQ